MLAFVAAPLAKAELLVVDQSATPQTLDAAFLLSSGVAQEFFPTLPALDFVDVGLRSMDPNDSGTFQVRIHEGSLGNIVGISDPISISTPGPGLLAHFEFPNSISLTPGETYLFDIPHSGPFWGAIVGPSTYQGQAFISGQWSTEQDLWFREGVIVPEPATWKLAGSVLGLLWLNRNFKNLRRNAEK
jgi:hypothetical protein